MIEPTAFYQQRQIAFAAESATLRKRYDQLSYARLFAFILGIALIIYAGSFIWWAGFITAFIFLPAFAYGVRQHQKIKQAADHAGYLAALAEAELRALDYDFSEWPAGEQFINPLHPYTADLDIFGPHSLYQFLNRTVTARGADRLARWLEAPHPTSVIEKRQQAIIALGKQAEWCHEFRARGQELNDNPSHHQRLLSWLAEKPLVANSWILKAALWFIPLCCILTIYLLLTLPIWQFGLLGLLPVALIMRKHTPEIQRLHTFTAQAGEALVYYAQLLQWIEDAHWENKHLLGLQSPLLNGNGAGRAVGQLRYAVSQLDVRYNAFSALLEISGLWSLQWIYRLEKWRAQHKEALPAWFESLAEVDALVSFANLTFNQPEWAFAKVAGSNNTAEHTEPGIYGVSLGHPLLDGRKRIANDLNIATNGHINLVTGSNMAGKSTWLRTVGINIVLALTGAPVCAKSLRLPQLQVWTSMRTQDALHESTSSFFAELKRLKAIIEAVEAKDKSIFFLLDEILKGTNSRDRHTGARALIRQLIQAQGAGIIATHDLELAELEKEAGSQVENYAMEVQIENGELVFDYKLHRGVSQSFNATVLMAEMGIRIDEKDINLHHE